MSTRKARELPNVMQLPTKNGDCRTCGDEPKRGTVSAEALWNNSQQQGKGKWGPKSA